MSNDQVDGRRLRVHDRWTAEREATVRRRLARARGRWAWPWPRLVAVSLAAAAVAVVALFVFTRGRTPEAPLAHAPAEQVTQPALEPIVPVASAPVPVAPHDRRVRFRDGSTAFLATAETDLKIVSVQERRIVSELVAGAARFEISKRPSRVFRVLAGKTAVQVLGTTFELERRDDRLSVRVLEGRVRVAWSRGKRQLEKGEEGVFPPETSRSSEARRAGIEASPERVRWATYAQRVARLEQHKEPVEPAQTTGRSENTDADAGAEPVAESAAAPPREEDYLATVLRRADEARARGRSVDAATALREVTQQGASDPRVPLAEFRLGRLLLEDLSQPREAAGAFARARTLAPNGPLASDALAREVEARAVCGEKERAKTLAREYLNRYPKGSHVAWVRRWGGLD